ncbi:hypothetical protein ACFWCB_19505 [Streptomyces sp. NPDC060048]|uniref:hypothetical protein n=1 Tax=unclassified Streptomyces TaxID=2593676 RepID=UPI0036A75D35
MLPMIDSTVPLLLRGYGWLPDLRRRHQDATVVRTRLGGHRAVAPHGPEAVEFFYDERHAVRGGLAAAAREEGRSHEQDHTVRR